MRASWESYGKNQGAAFRLNSSSQSWLGAVGLFVVVGIVYFLAARVGVVLGVSQGVPIFWPAVGIAVGAFITLGPNARLLVAVAVVAATIASGILIGRSLSLTITFAFFNTGEALLTAWLIERWFGRAFTLEAVRQVLGFVVASAVSEAIAASGAGIVVHFLEPATSSAHAWRLWFASCSLGIFTVAPLVIGLGEIMRELPPRRELIEGTAGLATLAALSVFVISLQQSPWATALPVTLVLPLILWIAVRCRPAFAAAAMFIVALAVIWSTTFDVGQFADASVPLSDRILATQTLVLAAALLALVLAALFAERRRSEAALAKKSAALAHLHEISSRLWLKRDLRQALDEILTGAVELLGADMGIIRILDPIRGLLKIEAHRGFKQELVDSFRDVSTTSDAPCGRTLRSGERIVIADVEADELFKPFHPHSRSAGFRAAQSTPIISREGLPLGTLTTHFHHVHKPAEQDLRLLDLYVRQAADIIERHEVEDTLRESEERLRLAQMRTGVGVWDANLRANSHVDARARGYLRARARNSEMLRRFSRKGPS